MKILTPLIAASLLVASAGVSADDYLKRMDANTIVLNAMQSKQDAYQLGLDTIELLKSLSSTELSRTLNVHSFDADPRTVSLKDNSTISVQEKMDANGNLAYVGQVKVGFSYLVSDTGD